MTDDEKAQWRAWMDRPVDCNRCGGLGGHKGTCMLDSWRDWFDGDTCLAVMSSRTGPDVTTVAAKKCDCSQCNPNGGE